MDLAPKYVHYGKVMEALLRICFGLTISGPARVEMDFHKFLSKSSVFAISIFRRIGLHFANFNFS